jgi:predicted enzyme related to lactoylglutathione lyase
MWVEVLGNDADKLQGFFGELFGWSFKSEPGPKKYGVTDCAETGVGGGVGAVGPSWTTFYVGVPDVKASLKRAIELGGRELMPVTKLPAVTVAVFADPEGHPIGLVEQPA